MFTRILTDVERGRIKKFVRRDGEKGIGVRKIVYGAKKHLPTIEADLALLKQLLQTYEQKRHSQ
jgi:hypothetical protein